MKKFITEFKAFIAKGNVVDMAVAVIIGGAFGKIVTSLVNDVIMPLVGLMMGGNSVADLKWVITPAKAAVVDPETGAEISAAVAETALKYGSFIQTVVDFLIIAFSVFVMLKIVLGAKDKLTRKKKVEEEAAPAEPEVKTPTTEELLTEIRDLLAKGADKNSEG